jgi:NAD+ diphosphatase
MNTRSASIGFNSNSLDRRSDRRDDEAFIAGLLAHPDTRFLVFDGDVPFLRRDASDDPWFSAEEAASFGNARHRVFLGEESGGRARFALDVSSHGSTTTPAATPPATSHDATQGTAADTDTRTPHHRIDLRSIALQGLVHDDALGMLGEAKSMLDWHRRHSFCANCGSPSRVATAGWQRVCDTCGAHHFPRVDPVVIMLVIDGDRCLLGRQRHFSPGMYSALAGFVEPGETAEAAVRREVMEEAGVACTQVEYFASQPWPFPSSLMIGCFARADGTDIVVDQTELEDARWFTREEVTAMLAGAHPGGLSAPKPFAIAFHLLQAYVAKGAAVLRD